MSDALFACGVAWIGWALAAGATWALRHSRVVAVEAEHELRGAAAAIAVAAERLERGWPAGELVPGLRLQLARMAGALQDLGGPRLSDSSSDSARVAQLLCNLSAAVAELGIGPVEVATRREQGMVRLELRGYVAARTGRGRGGAIARRATRAVGGQLRETREADARLWVIDLPPPDDSAQSGSDTST